MTKEEKEVIKKAIEDGTATDEQRRTFWLKLIGIPKDQLEHYMTGRKLDPLP